jgi:SAM-dependent methyltransferase
MHKNVRKILSNLHTIRGIKKLNFGLCPICSGRTLFLSLHPWLRDNYRCIRCLSIPRQRAIVKAVYEYAPAWGNLRIFEPGPGGASSDFLRRKAKNYCCSQYFPDAESGTEINGYRCENLEDLSFEDSVFDLVITQDVMEHVFNPAAAFAEIGRVLKPGGLYIFTVPCRFDRTWSEARAVLKDDEIEHIKPPEYHKNPIAESGSLVTIDYGRDLPWLVDKWSGLKTLIVRERDSHYGLDGEYLDVFVCRKAESEQ